MKANLEGEKYRQGRIEVVCGSMFSGKTEELIRRIKRATFARQRVVIFKPQIDTRYSEEEVVSHDRNSVMSVPLSTSAEILNYLSSHTTSTQCTPFGPIPALCAVADEVTKVHAICVKCGALAYVSHRLVHDQNQVLIGEQAEYEPLCRECYKKAMEQ